MRVSLIFSAGKHAVFETVGRAFLLVKGNSAAVDQPQRKPARV
jgi:hypothetical protein